MATPMDKLIIELSKQNETLRNLLDENARLTETIFSETSKERLEHLIDKTNKNNENLKRVFDVLNDSSTKLSGIAKDFKEDNIEEKLQQLAEAIESKKRTISNPRTKNKKKYQRQLAELTKAYQLLSSESSKFYSSVNEQQKELNRRQEEGLTGLDDFHERWTKRTNAFQKGIQEITSNLKTAGHTAWGVLEPWRKANQEAMAYAKNMGMSQKSADAYLAKTVSWASKNNIGILFNKSTDELIKMQGKYSEVLGRNVQLTNEQKKDMLAMETFLGEDGMMDIANNLENFGLGMSDSANFIKETMDDATKSGIAASKLTKTIRENIKMAQNYTFKDGLRGLESMAKKAIELKTDMSLVSSFIDKVSTVEGAITTGANLQVLGGSYALGSDPLSMLYESLNDVEGLFDRAVGMARGKVFYNSGTGNFEMGAMDRYMMKQAAVAMGVDPNKMMDVAFRQASLNRIEGQARMNSNIAGDADMMNLVKNLATWDNGNAVIDIDGKSVKVSDLTGEDKAKLESMQKTDSQNLQDMAISLRSLNDVISGTQKEINNEQANTTHGIAQNLTNVLKVNTNILNKIAQIAVWTNLIQGAVTIGGAVFNTSRGVGRISRGFGNLIDTKPTSVAPVSPSAPSPVPTGGLWSRGRTFVNNHALRINGSMIGGAAAGGALAGGMSLIGDAISGELKKDTGASIGDALGAGIGGAIGSFFGPIGTMVGSWIGGITTDAIQDAQKKKRKEIRDAISQELASTLPQFANLFTGDNALQGNYNKRQLNKIKEALSDSRITDDELSGAILRKARANGDLERMRNSNVNIEVPMARGGLLNGNSHSEGGMPILGSNIVVEGGEYVINKVAAEQNLPLLEKINSGKYSMSAREPLGKQMKVYQNKPNVSVLDNQKLQISPVTVNLTGTIKLDLNGKQIDITDELTNNPQFIRKMTDMISKQINIYDNGAYNKGNFKQKFI